MEQGQNLSSAQVIVQKKDANLGHQAGDWRWSSFRHYAFREIGAVQIESEWTARDREVAAKGGAPRVFLLPG